eukprot:2116031-Rhodomonas_salina.1
MQWSGWQISSPQAASTPPCTGICQSGSESRQGGAMSVLGARIPICGGRGVSGQTITSNFFRANTVT